MTRYSINIAKAFTMSDWQGQPAHAHMAKITLADTMSQAAAETELHRLTHIYPFPEYHIELSSYETVTTSQTLLSAAPREFLDKKLWSQPSIHD